MSVLVPQRKFSPLSRGCRSRARVAAVIVATFLCSQKVGHAQDDYHTWETMICRSDAIVEVELTVGDRAWGVGKQVKDVRAVEVLMNLSNPNEMPTLDDQDDLKDRLERRINWLRMRARKEATLGKHFNAPSDATTWRAVVFLYRARGATAFSPHFGSASSSGVGWKNHQQHSPWKKLIKRYIRKRMRAHTKGAALPKFCSNRTLQQSAFKRYTLPPPCEEPCEDD